MHTKVQASSCESIFRIIILAGSFVLIKLLFQTRVHAPSCEYVFRIIIIIIIIIIILARSVALTKVHFQ